MRPDKKTVEKLKHLKHAMLDEKGRELLNPNPLYVEVGPRRLTLQEQIRRVLHTEISRQAYDQGFESFEESEDFDIEDEFDLEPDSSYEEVIEEEFDLPEVEPEVTAPADPTPDPDPGQDPPADPTPDPEPAPE